MAFTLTSPAFQAGDKVPVKYTCSGQDVSPPLEWQDVPPDAKSLVLICLDPDAPSGVFHHWAIFDMLPDTPELTEGIARKESIPGGSRQAINDFGKSGYSGPCPPRGRANARSCGGAASCAPRASRRCGSGAGLSRR